MGVFGDPIQE